jgi:putative sigma-54 modulation protein
VARHSARLARRLRVPGGVLARETPAAPARGSAIFRSPVGECLMNLNLTGQRLEITPAIRNYVVSKLERVNRHFDHVIDVSVVMSVDKLRQKVEANVHVRGKDIHAESVDADMYAAIDALADKLDRQVVKHKELLKNHRCDSDAIARAATVQTGTEGNG